MNSLVSFRLCTLSNDELIAMVDDKTDEIFKTGNIPSRHIPARPDGDYDLLVGELLLRFKDSVRQAPFAQDHTDKNTSWDETIDRQ